MKLSEKAFAFLDEVQAKQEPAPFEVTRVTRPKSEMLPRKASNDGASNIGNTGNTEKQQCQSDTAVADQLGRSLAYLTAPDDRLPGLCLFSQDDIQDIESGALPLDNAKRYLEQMEQQYPHLQSGGDDSGEHPLLKAMDDLKHSGIELVPEDRRYIRDKIGHRMNWATFLDGYKREWLAAMEGCLPHQKQNRGRFAANTWLGRDGE